jgi:hypothetical protein
MNKQVRAMLIVVGLVFATTAGGLGWLAVRDAESSSNSVRYGLIVALSTLSLVSFVGAFLMTDPPVLNAGHLPGEFVSGPRLLHAIESEMRNARSFILLATLMVLGGVALVLLFRPSGAANQPADWFQLVRDMSPVLLVETIGFYYLRLYRASLNSIRSYHNELTNLDAQAIALRLLNRAEVRTPPSPKLAKLRAAVVDRLLRTERNRILEKGQSTDGLREQEQDRALLERLLGVANERKVDKK